MTVTLRSAGLDDLDAVVGVFLGCWRETYASRLPESLVQSLTDQAARTLWRRALTGGDRHCVVALLDESVCGVVGFAAGESAGWIRSLYVAPTAQGAGVGSTLLEHATEQLVRAGCTEGHLWVFEGNTPSVAFYARHGWQPDGASRVEKPFGENEIRLSQVLRPAPETRTA